MSQETTVGAGPPIDSCNCPANLSGHGHADTCPKGLMGRMRPLLDEFWMKNGLQVVSRQGQDPRDVMAEWSNRFVALYVEYAREQVEAADADPQDVAGRQHEHEYVGGSYYCQHCGKYDEPRDLKEQLQTLRGELIEARKALSGVLAIVDSCCQCVTLTEDGYKSIRDSEPLPWLDGAMKAGR